MAGVTLMELLVTLSIAVIVMTVAVPGFSNLIAETRRVTAVNELVGALNMARSEAIKRGVRVTLCKTDAFDPSNPACVLSASWNGDWLLFVDNDHESGNSVGAFDGVDTLLRIFPARGNLDITSTAGFAGAIAYRPDGTSQGIRANGTMSVANGSYTLCAAGIGRQLVINRLGRVSIRSTQCA